MTDDGTMLPQPEEDGPTTVLEVFGVKLAVKNRRLAEVLTMDAAEALRLDILSSKRRAGEADVTDAGPQASDTRDSPDSPGESEEMFDLAAARHRAEAAGLTLGFETLPAATWRSPDGPLVHVRVVDVGPDEAAPSQLVRKVAESVLSGSDRGESVLLVLADSASAQACARAVARQQLSGDVRVVSLDALERLARTLFDGPDIHRRALWLLVPARSVDVGSGLDFLGDR
jgi:hypothetical protein